MGNNMLKIGRYNFQFLTAIFDFILLGQNDTSASLFIVTASTIIIVLIHMNCFNIIVGFNK